MSCTKPLKAFRSPAGDIRLGENPLGPQLELPCGQCLHCRLAKTRDWAIRCVHEAQMHEKNSFITLTYNENYLPTNNSVNVRHWQLFAKRLRKAMGPFRFLHCGEYGEENKRPHYHACLFGIDFSDDRVVFSQEDGHILWVSPQLEEIWGQGWCRIGPLNFDTAAYCAAYLQKKITGPTIKPGEKSDQRLAYETMSLEKKHRAYQRVDSETGEVTTVKPEYATMSRRPGLGTSWFNKYQQDVYPDDHVIMKGKKFRPPKHYDNLLEKKNPTLLEKLKLQRKKKSDENPEEQNDKRRQAHNTVLQAKLTQKKRPI